MKFMKNLIKKIKFLFPCLLIASCGTTSFNNQTLYIISNSSLMEESKISFVEVDDKNIFLDYFNQLLSFDSKIEENNLLNDLISDSCYKDYKVALIGITSSHGARPINLTSLNYESSKATLEFNYQSVKNGDYGSLNVTYRYFFIKLDKDIAEVNVEVNEDNVKESLKYSY